ncbi:MAG: rhodanese-like domain-containing protein [Ilumatobacteraceae bacterium]
MLTDVDIDQFDRLLADGALLIEVLPRGEYDDEHVPGAVNIPLRDLTAQSVAHIDRANPIVVYCWDSL